jgi:hypothetical protein
MYSGLFSYEIDKDKWTLIYDYERDKTTLGSHILKRFDPFDDKIYIFGGCSGSEFLSDLYSFCTTTRKITRLAHRGLDTETPDPMVYHHMCLKKETREIFVYSGSVRDKRTPHTTVNKSTLWCYKIEQDRWEKVFVNDNLERIYWKRMGNKEPLPRFSHQFVYLDSIDTFFLFGGNANTLNSPLKDRLNDFWSVKVKRQDIEILLQKIQYNLKRDHYLHLCSRKKLQEALQFLREDLKDFSDRNPGCSEEFSELCKVIFVDGAQLSDDELRQRRLQLFEDIVKLLPSNMTHPVEDLTQLLR